MVKVLVGQKRGGGFPGFWAEFEGEEVSRYEDPQSNRNAVYTLFRCTAYNFEAYRVHVFDESSPEAPVYELLPFEGDQRSGGGSLSYSEVWDREDIAGKFPMFLKDMDYYFDTRHVDPGPGVRSRQL
jgi:hypothetical protein